MKQALGFALGWLFGSWLFFVVQAQPAEQNLPNRYALLIGVTRYPSLTGLDLHGPGNDVLLMQDLLQDQFRFSPNHITILSDAAGQKEPNRLPTRAHIEREFQRLARIAKPGDQFVVFLAGHGSQQPAFGDSENIEPDGLDEIFLPQDVEKWKGVGTQGEVPRAIRDDELGAWIAAIREKKSSVWLIVDACHSGTMLRGVGEVIRQVPTGEGGLNIPADVLNRARQRALAQHSAKQISESPLERSPLQLGREGGIVATRLYMFVVRD